MKKTKSIAGMCYTYTCNRGTNAASTFSATRTSFLLNYQKNPCLSYRTFPRCPPSYVCLRLARETSNTALKVANARLSSFSCIKVAASDEGKDNDAGGDVDEGGGCDPMRLLQLVLCRWEGQIE